MMKAVRRPLRWLFFVPSVVCATFACALNYDMGPSSPSGSPDGGGGARDGNVGGEPDGGPPDGSSTDGNVEKKPPSCAALTTTCAGGRDCCSSNIVASGTFKRGNTGPTATLSEFRLDVFEVTVGRFRAFVEAGKGTRASPPENGAGAQPGVPGSGWISSAFDSQLRDTKEQLEAALACDSMPTWTSAPGSRENYPINCITWYEALAFCIWDGGWMPTRAAWNYAAAGGAEQRPFPMGNTISESTATYGCKTSCDVSHFRSVGSKSAAGGDGRWSHADQAGSVWEWVLDYSGNMPEPCEPNCANLTEITSRLRMGGNVSSESTGELGTGSISAPPSGTRSYSTGVRCARPR